MEEKKKLVAEFYRLGNIVVGRILSHPNEEDCRNTPLVMFGWGGSSIDGAVLYVGNKPTNKYFCCVFDEDEDAVFALANLKQGISAFNNLDNLNKSEFPEGQKIIFE